MSYKLIILINIYVSNVKNIFKMKYLQLVEFPSEILPKCILSFTIELKSKNFRYLCSCLNGIKSKKGLN